MNFSNKTINKADTDINQKQQNRSSYFRVNNLQTKCNLTSKQKKSKKYQEILYIPSSKYYGKLVWNKTADKLDINNPDKTQHTVLIRGKELLKNFDYDGSGLWHNGTIYDPKNGKTYSCKVTRDEKGNLNVRGFIGVSLIGRTSYWIKVK